MEQVVFLFRLRIQGPRVLITCSLPSLIGPVEIVWQFFPNTRSPLHLWSVWRLELSPFEELPWPLPHEWAYRQSIFLLWPLHARNGHVSGQSAVCSCLGPEQTSCFECMHPWALQCKQNQLLPSGPGPFLESPHCHSSFGLGDELPCGKQAGSCACHKLPWPPVLPSLTVLIFLCHHHRTNFYACLHAVDSLGAQTKS